MKVTARTVSAALLATGMLALSSTALATNGYFTHGVGTESKGMAGSGVASPDNMGGISVATNPALGVFSDDKWQVGMAIFSPMRSYTASDSIAQGNFGAFTLGSGEYDSENEAFPVPYIAKNWTLDSGNAISFVFYGRGGMNTEWDSGQVAMFDPTGQGGTPATLPGVFGGGAFGPGFANAGVDLMQAFLSVNYAWKVSDRFAIGFGPVAAVQLFEATGLPAFSPFTQTFADNFPGHFGACMQQLGDPVTCGGLAQQQAVGDVTRLTNNSHDTSTGFGAAIGVWGGSEAFSYGLAYQSKMSMSEFDDYADLFAQDGGFDIPSTIKGGVSFRAGETSRVNLDVEHIAYSDVDSVHNSVMNLISGCWSAGFAPQFESSGCLGGPNGAGFGWEDMTVYKAGFVWQADDSNTWRLGFSYGEQPIRSGEVVFNILAPGVMENHLTVGWTNVRPSGSVMSWSLMYAPPKKITGVNTFDPTQTIELEMQQLELEFAWRF